MYMENWWDTTNLCETFDVDGACNVLVDETPVPWGSGMTGLTHTEEAKDKISQSLIGIQRPHLHKGGSIVSPGGEVIHYTTLSHFCQAHGLSCGHVSELMSGKRRSVKGWRKA